MRISRRTFVGTAAAMTIASTGRADQRRGNEGGTAAQVPDSIRALKPFPGHAVPISDDERRTRIEKARRLMTENGLGAIVLEPGTSMTYYVNVRWGLSERPFLLVIPAMGELAYISPGFEEQRAREITRFTNDVRVWQEDEDWGALVAGVLKDRGVATGKVGVEERVRFFIPEGLRRVAPQIEFVLATPVTAGCRMFKSSAEIALMQRANDITIEAYKAAFAALHEGMTNSSSPTMSGPRSARSALLADRPARSSASTPHSLTAASSPSVSSRATSCWSTAGARLKTTRPTSLARPSLESRASGRSRYGIWRNARRPLRSPPRRWARRASPSMRPRAR